jgi:hypothetical protein
MTDWNSVVFDNFTPAEGPRYLIVPPGVYVKVEKGHEPEFYVLSEELGEDGLQTKEKASPEDEAAAREWLEKLQKKIEIAAAEDMVIAKGRTPAYTTLFGVPKLGNPRPNRAQRREALKMVNKNNKPKKP